MRITTAATVIGLALLGTITLAQNITYDFDRSAPFARFKTYSWVKGTPERIRDAAGDIGSDVHDEADRLVQKLAMDSGVAWSRGEEIDPWPPHLQGQSWGQYLRKGVFPPPRDVFVVGNFAGYAPGWNERHLASFRTVITPDAWKLSISDTGEGELYRLDKDPKERVNLYHRTESRAQVKELSEKIRRWQDETGDRVAVPSLDVEWPRTRPASR